MDNIVENFRSLIFYFVAVDATIGNRPMPKARVDRAQCPSDQQEIQILRGFL